MSETNLQIRPIIGLEIHVQLRTQTKLFCGCRVQFDAPPNSRTCPVCLGHPGALPVMNERAVELSILTGLALGCTIPPMTKWDRKSYYYPDLPKNYQISQYDMPLAERGEFEVSSNGRMLKVRIKRAHLEEDAGKNLHDVPGCTLVDLNRAGTPLLEIVTEPDLASADDALVFCTELQRLVTYLDVSEASMQKGQMRFEPNVNVAITCDGREYRTPIAEIKNLNSFRSVRNAIAHDIERQVETWRENHEYVIGKAPNENRGWNDDRGTTEFQRPKEAAHDYRYFPDPDLVPVEINEKMLTAIRSRLPELPIQRRQRFMEKYGLTIKDAETIVSDRGAADLFEETIASGGPAEVVGKQFVNVWLRLANDRGVSIRALGVDSSRLARLAIMAADGTVNKTAANQLAEFMLTRPEVPEALAREMGLIQVQDTAATQAWVAEAFSMNQSAVEDAVGNPKKAKAAAGFLRGQVMKISGGKADPKLVGELIDVRLRTLGEQKNG